MIEQPETQNPKPGTSPAVAPQSAGPANGTPPAAPALPVSPASFGGNPSGRSRKDGLVPGSAEAIAADREKERLRKQAARAVAAKLVEPPKLPSADPLAPGAPAPPNPGQPGSAPGEAPGIAWDPELLKPLIKEVVTGCEQSRVAKFKRIAENAEMAKGVVQQIAEDAEYVPAFKGTLLATAPRAIAKLLNRSGVSGEWSDEALCVLACVSIFVHGKRMEAKIKDLIEQSREEAKPEEKKP